MTTVTQSERENFLHSLHVFATFVSHRRSQRRLHPKQNILKIDHVLDREAAMNYINNAVLFTYKNKEGEIVNIKGRIMACHGNKGAVRAAFEKNLNPKAVGQRVYVKLYKVEV
ncbi:ribosomal prt L35A [Nucleospora cyclopteri]